MPKTQFIDPNEPCPTMIVGKSMIAAKKDATENTERVLNTQDLVIPGYELVKLIGRGGFGQVFQARQYKLDRFVAIKLIRAHGHEDDDEAAQFEREAFALGKFHHPNIVPVFDFGRASNYLYLVMELLEGEDLATRLRNSGSLDECTLWHIIRQAAAGLAHSVAHGIIHRDVKPSNLFLTQVSAGSMLDPRIPSVKVLDFGLALTKQDGRLPDQQRDTPNLAVGTPAFMAPEYHLGGIVDLRADIYSLGATAYQALTGRLPFQSNNVPALMMEKQQEPMPLPEQFSESWDLVRSMMAPNVSKRPQSYEELIGRIDALSMMQVGSSRQRTVPRRTSNVLRWLAWGAAFIAVVAIITVVVVLSLPSSLVRPPTNYISIGSQEALFDGASLERWAMSGSWSVDSDSEGTPILLGSGALRRALPHEVDYRVAIGLDSREASTTEIQFAIPKDSPNAVRHVVRISKTQGAVLGRRTGERGAFQALGTTVNYPSESWFVNRRPYLEVRLERTGDIWSAWFHGQWLGSIRAEDSARLDEFRLNTEGGSVALDSAVFERLQKRK